MRIAITGAVGTGKTTLALAVAEQYGLTLIEEEMSAVVKTFVAMKKEIHLEEQRKAATRQHFDTGFQWLQRRAQARETLENFVEDRFGFDLLAWWISTGVLNNNNALLIRTIKQCKNQAGKLDLIVMPPLSLANSQATTLASVDQFNEEALERTSHARRLLHHSLLRGLMDQFLTTPRLYLPGDADTPQKRVQLIDKALQRRGLISNAGVTAH